MLVQSAKSAGTLVLMFHLPLDRLPLDRLPLDRLPRVLEDGAYVAVGAAVLGFQRAQVARREIEKRLPPIVRDLERDLPGEALSVAKEAVAFGRFALNVLRAPASRPNYP